MEMGKEIIKGKYDNLNIISPEKVKEEEQWLVFQKIVLNDTYEFWGRRLQSLINRLSQLPENWEHEKEREEVQNEMRNIIWRIEHVEDKIGKKLAKDIDKFNLIKEKSLFKGFINKVLKR